MTDLRIKILNGVTNIHFIGIGGIGMSGIAEYLVKNGYDVSGSDMVLSDITARLSECGIRIFEGHKESNLPENTGLVVYSAAVKNDNPELIKAKALGINSVKRAKMLGEIVNDKFLIAISGTHGKTSTTAMISKILIDCKFDPTVFVGGTVDFLEDGNSRIGNGKYAVVEADEYDRSFLNLKPDIAVITNVDLDHTDIYKDLDDLKNTFREFISSGSKNMKVVGFGDDKNVIDVMDSLDKLKCISYGFGLQNNYVIEKLEVSNTNVQFGINKEKIELSVPGGHNILNATASYIVGELIGLDRECVVRQLKSFYGVNRRLEVKYNKEVIVYDDYAHHPTEIKYSFEAVKEIAISRVITVFQPHTFTRTRDFYEDFANALRDNNIVILAELYPAREKHIEGVSSQLIFDELVKMKNENVFYEKTFDGIIKKLKEVMLENDTIIFQGAGNITDLCKQFVNELKNSGN